MNTQTDSIKMIIETEMNNLLPRIKNDIERSVINILQEYNKSLRSELTKEETS